MILMPLKRGTLDLVPLLGSHGSAEQKLFNLVLRTIRARTMSKSKRAEYTENAIECQRMADQSRQGRDKAAWLRLAEKWLRLIPKSASDTASEAFDVLQSDKGTGQKNSTSSH